jgi:hypothetical protein
MISAAACEIEALFGSVARRDADTLSDIDFLIVDDDPLRLKTRKRWLEGQGLSVADYTWPRFVRLFERQTLFAMHLKLESRVLHDGSGRYRDLLSTTWRRSSYEDDFRQSLALFEVLQQIPASSMGRAWVLDHIAVAFRNSSILLLANDGEYVFSFSKVIDRMTARIRYSDQEAGALHKLRTIKRLYRSGSDIHPTKEDVYSALQAADHAFQLGLGVEERRGPIIAPDVAGSTSTEAYLYLRYIERELVSISHRYDRQFPAERQQLLNVVRDPHQYLWQAIYAADQIRTRLEVIRGTY